MAIFNSYVTNYQRVSLLMFCWSQFDELRALRIQRGEDSRTTVMIRNLVGISARKERSCKLSSVTLFITKHFLWSTHTHIYIISPYTVCIYIYICGRDLWGLFRSYAYKHVMLLFFFSFGRLTCSFLFCPLE